MLSNLNTGTVKPRFKTTLKLRPLHYSDHHFKVPFHSFLLYLNSKVRPPHYKDHFASDQVVVLIAEFYCILVYWTCYLFYKRVLYSNVVVLSVFFFNKYNVILVSTKSTRFFKFQNCYSQELIYRYIYCNLKRNHYGWHLEMFVICKTARDDFTHNTWKCL